MTKIFSTVDASSKFKGGNKSNIPSPKKVQVIKNPKGKIHPGEVEAELYVRWKCLELLQIESGTVQNGSH